MKKIFYSALTGLLISSSVHAGMEDDPVITKTMIDQVEVHSTDNVNIVVLEGQTWIGKDLEKVWFKYEVEQVGDETEEIELQALYSRAFATYWDFQVGVRTDIKPEPSQSWVVLGFQGLAPYFFEVDSALFIRDTGHVGLRLEAEYEILFTQKLILAPEIEVNFHSKEDLEAGFGSGLSNSVAGIRLRYEIKREFAPYIGANWINKYGKTATLATDNGQVTKERHLVLGFRAWF